MRIESFVIEAGFLIRRRVISAVTSVAWERGLECSHERMGGSIRFTVIGPPKDVSLFLIGIQETFG